MTHDKEKAADQGPSLRCGVTTAVNGSGVKYWRIRLGKRFTGGPIVLKDFRNLDDAREWVTKQRAQAAATGQASYSLTMAQMADAKTAFDLLKGKTSLAICANYWLKHAAPRGGVKTWKDISSEFLTTRRAMGCKPKTLVQYESYLRVIGEEWNDVNLSEIKRQDIEDWLAETEWSGRTRKNYLVTLTTIFGWATEREYCGENPAKKISRPILDENAPGILTPIQAEALLQTAKECLPEMVVPIAIGLFAGLRRSELCALGLVGNRPLCPSHRNQRHQGQDSSAPTGFHLGQSLGMAAPLYPGIWCRSPLALMPLGKN